MQEIKKVSVSSSELNPGINNIGINVCSDYMNFGVSLSSHCKSDWSGFDDFLKCDFVEFPSGSGEFVPIDHYLEVLFDECDRKEVRNVD